MASQRFLSVDLGAESGRGVVAEFDGERVILTELGRFTTGRGREDLGADDVRRWDFARIASEIEGLLARAVEGGEVRGVGVDSWGVDHGFLDADGSLLAPPVAYRDLSHAAAHEEILTRIPREELWDATGIQPLSFNTLYQIAARQKDSPEILDRAHRMLMIPDLMHHVLTGKRSLSVEATNASTTQMQRPGVGGWNVDLLNRLGLPSHFLGDVVSPGTRVGVTPGGVPVYAPGTHDTASAVAAAPVQPGSRWAFLSSGTWSLLGAELPAPVLSREAMEMGFSNEGGVAGTTRFLKNIMGLWLVQECRRSLAKTTGRQFTYPELVTLAEAARPDGPLIDAVAPRFLAPADMAEEIRAACEETGQTLPGDAGALIRCCLESLAMAYRLALRDLGRLLGQEFDVLHVIGGGSQNLLLNQWTADACGVTVQAGPSEATAVGNALGQLVASGAVADWAQAREVSRRSADVATFTPNPARQAHWAQREREIVKLWAK
ncbi:carbohydrate kinase [Capsulimonas corticalis]|uniref:Carbohydrate kinase n=1 Tax=Capsulimonas corticalis TaxID=2219043 RepID=A0A402CVA1_9BACT|nr:rhamnulokinase family protein [Capsulimonas corticalis]BDI30327.1 carbohydrate kinase [Capsulimonas corticalis]